jgi:hypothetical protein
MQSNATPPSSVDHSPLFKLPPELRDMIYDYAFSTKHCVTVTKQAGIPEPALLLTCKVVREEAIAVFYRERRLHPIVHGFDSTVILLWQTKRRHMVNDYNMVPTTPKVVHEGPRMWVNLIHSLELYHGRKLWIISKDRPSSGSSSNREESVFIAGLFKVVRTMRGRPWEEVRGVLDMLRLGLVKFHPTWRL